MRLIDADKYRKELLDSRDFEPFKLLDMQPTIEERKKGKWKEDSGNIACSHCHTIWLYRRTDYCPNCGADMRKEGSND